MLKSCRWKKKTSTITLRINEDHGEKLRKIVEDKNVGLNTLAN